MERSENRSKVERWLDLLDEVERPFRVGFLSRWGAFFLALWASTR